MKFKDYVKACNDLLAKNESFGDLEVFYSIDDEGNGFGTCNFEPSVELLDEDHGLKGWITLEDGEEVEINAETISEEQVKDLSCERVIVLN